MTKLQKDWKKEPELAELKKDFDLVKSNHDTEVAKITKARNLKNIEGGAKLAKVAGRSNVQPKLIRKNNEWQYASTRRCFALSTSTGRRGQIPSISARCSCLPGKRGGSTSASAIFSNPMPMRFMRPI